MLVVLLAPTLLEGAESGVLLLRAIRRSLAEVEDLQIREKRLGLHGCVLQRLLRKEADEVVIREKTLDEVHEEARVARETHSHAVRPGAASIVVFLPRREV